MKRYIGIIILSIILAGLVFYIGINLHIRYYSACGTGITGLKLLAFVGGLVLLVLMLFEWGKKRKTSCPRCRTPVDGQWEVCPHCGYVLIGGRKT